jgi:hypothetical protein
MRIDKARQFAVALDGLIRSRTKGDGGDEYARRCIDQIADALTDPPTTADFYARHDAAIEAARAQLARDIADEEARS